MPAPHPRDVIVHTYDIPCEHAHEVIVSRLEKPGRDLGIGAAVILLAASLILTLKRKHKAA
jgi:hypothetical protein